MKKGAMFTLAAAGLALAVAGLCLIKTASAVGGGLAVLPYLCIGAGCGAFGHGMGEILSRRTAVKYPEAQKRAEIEKGDERNIEISNRSKAKAYDAMIYIYGAVMMALALTDVELWFILLLVFAYLAVVGISIYYRVKFDREM